jgi:hypothetical protein
MPLADSLPLKSEMSSAVNGLAAHPRGLRLNIWNALQPMPRALSTEFEMPPEIET